MLTHDGPTRAFRRPRLALLGALSHTRLYPVVIETNPVLDITVTDCSGVRHANPTRAYPTIPMPDLGV
jgi:hypothetical protein